MTFWKPTLSVSRQLDETEQLIAPYNRLKTLSLQDQRIKLPVYANKRQIQYLMENYRVLIVVGATGSGKTTQIPQYLDEAGWTVERENHRLQVACTQPRRIAAITVANRVAEEMGCEVGEAVGYAVRFDDRTTDQTRIKYMTDGLLIREMMLDPLLLKYSVIMVDEAHERSLYTDVLLAMLHKVLRKRDDLRVIVSSATLDAELFQSFFSNVGSVTLTSPDGLTMHTVDATTILSLDGRMFPVDTFYLAEPCSDYVKTTVETVLNIHSSEPQGDVLCFLTGKEDIERCMALLSEKAESNLLPLPLHGALPPQEQLLAFQPSPNRRKVVLATNVAEASVTIDGIVYVIDCGFVKLRSYDPMTNLARLALSHTSLASAQQRSGRAGRTRPGKCFRLYTQETFHKEMVVGKQHEVPELCRTELHPILLQLKALGVENLAKLSWVTPPPKINVTRALEVLHGLNCIDDWGKLTFPMGERASELPLRPEMAICLLKAMEYGCVEEMLIIAAMDEVQDVFGTNVTKQSERNQRRFATYDGDQITNLNVFLQFMKHKPDNPTWCKNHGIHHASMLKARDAKRQLTKYLQRFFGKITFPSAGEDVEKILKCLCSGWFANAAQLQMDGTYKTIREGIKVEVHPTSSLYHATKPKYAIFHEATQNGERRFIRQICAIKAQWLIELAPSYYKSPQLSVQ